MGSRELRHPSGSPKKKLLIVSFLVLVMLSIPYALVYTFPPSEIEIDGYFMDWLKASVYDDVPSSENPDVAIAEYAVKADSQRTYFYLSTSGTILNGADQGADGYFFLMDVDGLSSTGYSVHGIGADAMVAIVGWDGVAELQSTYIFDERADRDDYAGFELMSRPLIAFKGGELELSTDVMTDPSSVFALCTRHTDMPDDWSDANFASSGPALQIMQFHKAPQVTSGLTDERMLTISITNKGSSVRLMGMNFELMGDAEVSEISVLSGKDVFATGEGPNVTFDRGMDIGRGRTVSLEIAVTMPQEAWGDSIGIGLSSANSLILDRNSTINIESYQTDSLVSYVGAAPFDVSIDGAFGDWEMRLPCIDPSDDVTLDGMNQTNKQDVDISSVKVSTNSELASFFMSVDGRMLGGAGMPGAIERWETAEVPSGELPNTTAHQPKFGSDSAFIFIDIDKNASTGFYIGGSEIAVTMIGKSSRILNASAYSYSESGWVWLGPVDAALDHYCIEVSASFSMLGLESDAMYSITFMSSDWQGAQDVVSSMVSTRASLGTRAFGGILINELYSTQPSITNDWVELYNTGPVPINIGGWTLYSGTTLIFTFPNVWIPSGGFYVTPLISLYKLQVFTLYDDDGVIIDSVAIPIWNARSYSRTGTPDNEYDTWAWTVPTPGEINQGQIPIPEFGEILAPLAIVPIMFLFIRRTRGARRKGRREAEGSKHG